MDHDVGFDHDTCNTRHVPIIRQDSATRTMANPYSCCEVVCLLGPDSTHQRCNIFNLGFSSNCCWPISSHIILKIISSLYKTFVPLTHSNTSSPYTCLIIRKVSLVDCLICDRNLRSHVAQTATFSTSSLTFNCSSKQGP